MSSWILSLLIFLPVIGALAMLIVSTSIGKENKNIYKFIALGTTGVQLFLAGFIAEMIFRNAYDRNNYQIEQEV